MGPVSTVSAAASGGVVRVSQLGYGALDGKAAYVMTRDAAGGKKFQVVDRNGHRVLTGRVGGDAGERSGWRLLRTCIGR